MENPVFKRPTERDFFYMTQPISKHITYSFFEDPRSGKQKVPMLGLNIRTMFLNSIIYDDWIVQPHFYP